VEVISSGISEPLLEGLFKIRSRNFSAAEFWRRFNEHARRVLQRHRCYSHFVHVRQVTLFRHVFYRGQKLL
jgi:hypothetical protein